ncbi:hypothetical protein ACNOYE_38305 [Nannocystaceae bacterium ST9]
MLAVSMLASCDDTEVGETDDEVINAEGELDPFAEDVSLRCALNGYSNVAKPMELTLWTTPYPIAFSSMRAASPTTSYVNAGCGDYYVIHATEVDAIGNQFNLLWAEPFWFDTIPNQNRCIWSVLYYDIAVRRNGVWHQRTTSFDVGNWNGTYCEIGGPVMISNPYDDIERVQVAVRGMYLDQDGQHYARVGAEVMSSDDPP